MLKVLALRCGEKLDSQKFQKILSFLDEDIQKKILSFYKWQDAQRSLLGNFLVRVTLCEMFQVRNSDIKIVRSKLGKPYADNIPQVSFNIAHSGAWIVAVFDSLPVGIDIEKIKEIDLDMARKILNIDDFKEMMSLKESERPAYFYKCWTFNESYVKMQGKGMAIPLQSVKKLSNKAIFKTYPLDSNYVLSVCTISSKTTIGNKNNLIETKLKILAEAR